MLVVADLCEIFSMVNFVQRTQYLEPTSPVFGHHYRECDCANGSTGIIINIDTISNINLKAGMCHMEVDWFITYRI